MLGLLRRCTLAFQKLETRRLLYITIVRTNFSRASQLWSPQKVELIQEMEKVQRRASKFILNLNYLSEITYKERLLSVRILPVSYWLELMDLLFRFKIINGLVSLHSSVCPSIFVAARSTRSSANNGRKMCVKKCKTTTYQNSYFIRVTILWNILPDDLTSENRSISYFKKNVYSCYNKALKDIYDINDSRTWKSVCIKCKTARLLNEVPHCCF